jgi:hypothetical protein
MSDIAIGRDVIVFAKAEATPGTAVFPAATDAIFLTGDGAFKQNRGFLPDQQRRDTFSKIAQYKGRLEPGEWNFPTYIKPSGSAGVAPECGQLLEGLFGKETVVGSTSVTYTLLGPGNEILTFSIYFRLGHTVFANLGCAVNSADIVIKAGNDDDALVGINFNGNFIRQIRTGTDALAAEAAAETTTITVDNARKFMIGSVIEIGSDNNSGAGYAVSDVNYETNVLTFSPELVTGQDIDAVVKGYLPTPTEVGEPIHGRLGHVTFDEDASPVNVPILQADIGINNNIKVLNEEKNNTDYPTDFLKTAGREVTLSVQAYFDTETMARYYEIDAQLQKEIKIPAGDTAGKKLRFEFPQVELQMAEVSGGEECILTMTKLPLASASFEDEIKLVFD